MEILGIVLAIVCMVYLAFKGYSIFITALVSAVVAILFNGLPILATLKDGFVGGTAAAFKSLFFVFFFGTLLGKIYEQTGAAVSVAQGLMKVFAKEGSSDARKHFAVIAIVMITGIGLGYGGINVIVLPVALYPLVLNMMKEADIPKRYIVGLVLAAIATVGMTGPGTPQVQNLIPVSILGTTATAALIPGIICSVFTIVLNWVFLMWLFARAKKRGDHFEYGPKDIPLDANKVLPNPLLAAAPLVSVFVFFNIVKLPIETSLLIGTLLSIVLLYKCFNDFSHLKKSLNEGSVLSLTSVLSICFMTGFGSVIKLTPAFNTLLTVLPKMPGNPLVTAVASTAAVCGFTGSASGGMALVLPIIAPIFAGLVVPAALHRCMSIASSSLDTLPFNGGFLMFCGLADLSVKDAYPTVFFTTVFTTGLSTILCVFLCITFPGIV